MYGKITYGNLGSFIVKLAILINNFGACCAFFKIFGNVTKTFVSLILDKESFLVNNFIYILLLFTGMFPMIFKKSIDKFKNFSFLGVLMISIFFFSLIFLFIYYSINGILPKVDSGILLPSAPFDECLEISTSVFMAYTFQMITFPIYFSLKKRNDKEMKQATNLGVIFCMIIYLFSSILAMIIFHDQETKDTVLDNFATVLNNPNTPVTIFITVIIVLFCFMLSATMSLPIIFFGYKVTVLNFVVFFKKIIKNKKNNFNTEENTNPYDKLLEEENNQEIERNSNYYPVEKYTIRTGDDGKTQEILIDEKIEEKIENEIEINKDIIKLSNFEANFWIIFSYCLIAFVTISIDKLEIVIIFIFNF